MNNKINILHLEDSINDSELICSLIERGGVGYDYFLVDNEKEYLKILETEKIDIILCDYRLPDYNGSEALKVAREKYSNIPFIFVSGTMGEDAAIDSMINGATDYVLKNKLERLVPAINRAIRERDILRKQKKAEEELRENEERYRLLFENNSASITIIDADTTISMVNEAYCQASGYTQNEVIGKSWTIQIPPDDLERLKEYNRLRMIDPKMAPDKYEFTFYNKNGEIRHALMSVAMLQRDKKIITSFVDITERKRAEDALRESETKYRNLIETMPEGFYRSTPEGYFIEVNPTLIKMLGYDCKEELMKVNIPEELYFSRDERIDGVNYNIDFVPETDVYRLKKKDGSEIWVEDHSRYIQDSSGKILYHEGIMRNITESLRAQKAILEAKEKAEEMSRLKSSFLANMSHEIRTPLSGILGFAEILKSELKDPNYIKFAEFIEKSGYRLLDTLDLILSFSKLEAEKVNMNYSNVHMEDVIDEVMQTFKTVAKSKNLFLIKDTGNENIINYMDEHFLKQIMNNLINNAIKYTDTGGVTVILLKENNNIVIKIKDTGIGIAEDKYGIVFEEFRQESEGFNRNFEGTGLGLSITKKFVELMKGTIKVESEVGVGSTFTVKFPYEEAPETITIKTIKEEPKTVRILLPPPGKKIFSILLVEDDEVNRDFTAVILNDYYNVETAVNGYEAIDKVKNKIYNVILMDINLGKDMNGMVVVREIRKLPGYAKTPIVALTAFVLPGDREEFIKGGCTHYLGKPFTQNQLFKLLNNITDNLMSIQKIKNSG